MANGNQERRQKPRSADGASCSSALESAASYIAGSAGAGSSSNESGKAFKRDFAALLEWGEEEGLICDEARFSILQRSPDARGHEHTVWFDELTNRWFKTTYPNRFGLAWGRNGSATAREYLTRLILQNRYF